METLQIFNKVVTYKAGLIPIIPLCHFFDLDVRNQQKKIKNDPVLGKSKRNSKNFGQIEKNRPILLNQKGFIRWVQLINPNTVRAELRDHFTSFQADVFIFFYGKAEEEAKLKKKHQQLNKMKEGQKKLEQRIKIIEGDIERLLKIKYEKNPTDFKQNQISE